MQVLTLEQDLVINQIAEVADFYSKQDLSQVNQIDLSKVKSIDSSGLAWLVTLQESLGRGVEICSMPENAKVLLRLYKLENILKLVGEVND